MRATALRSLGLVIMVLLPACGGAPPAPSVIHFGSATNSFAEGMAETARGSSRICAAKQELDWDQEIALGEGTATAILSALEKKKCEKFRRTGAAYAQLARRLGGFGEAMSTLAGAQKTDYTTELAEIGEGLPAELGVDPGVLEKSNGLVNQLIGWFTEGYSQKQLVKALLESREEVEATIDVLDAVIDIYGTQLKGYEDVIKMVATNQDFLVPPEGDPPSEADVAAVEIRRLAQIQLVKRHGELAAKRANVLIASKEALSEVRSVHGQLLKEAQRQQSEFGLESLMRDAGKLAAKVSEFRDLVRETQQEG